MSDLPIILHKSFDKILTQGHFRPNSITMLFIKEGHILFLVNDEIQECTTNHILIMSPMNTYKIIEVSQTIEFYSIRTNNTKLHYTNYNFDRYKMYCFLTIDKEKALPLSLPDFDIVWSILQNIDHVGQNNFITKYKNEILLHLFGSIAYMVTNYLESCLIRHDPKNSRKEIITRAFLELLPEHFIEHKELKFYADRLFISAKYLSISVKEVTGFAPTHFITRLTLDAACRKLSDFDKTISDIACELHFSDQFAFSKFFKKNMGITPSVFKTKTA